MKLNRDTAVEVNPIARCNAKLKACAAEIASSSFGKGSWDPTEVRHRLSTQVWKVLNTELVKSRKMVSYLFEEVAGIKPGMYAVGRLEERVRALVDLAIKEGPVGDSARFRVSLTATQAAVDKVCIKLEYVYVKWSSWVLELNREEEANMEILKEVEDVTSL